MTHLIRKHQRKVLAFFTIILMISFVATTGGRNSGSRGTGSVVANMNGKPVYSSSLEESHREWGTIKKFFIVVKEPATGQRIRPTHMLSTIPMLANACEERPDLFYMLVQEARQAPIRISDADVDAWLKSLKPIPNPPEGFDEALQQAMTDLLLVRENLRHSADAVKVSQPLVNRALAENEQSLSVETVELRTTRFLDRVAVPTTQQVQDQFNTYAKVAPNQPTDDNRFGFGYLLPQRVMLQCIEIPLDKVDAAIKATKDDYAWQVEAHKFYNHNPDQFRATPPPGTLQPTSQPTVEAYEKVEQKALYLCRQPAVNIRLREVQNKLVSTMNGDWSNYHRAMTATPPTTLPVTAVNAPYASLQYFEKLRDLIRDTFKVELSVRQIPSGLNGAYISLKDLEKEPEVNQARWGQMLLPAYIAQHAKPFVVESEKSNSQTMDLLQPSPPLSSAQEGQVGNVFVVRLIDARPAEAPADVTVAGDQIRSDLRNAAAYALTKDAAAKLLADANGQDLAPGAASAGFLAVTPPMFTKASAPQVPGIDSTDEASIRAFTQQTVDQLLGKYDPVKQPNPTAVVELPAIGRVYALRLKNVSATWNTNSNPDVAFITEDLRQREQYRQELQEIFSSNWFNPDAVQARVKWVAKETQKASGS